MSDIKDISYKISTSRYKTSYLLFKIPICFSTLDFSMAIIDICFKV